jgi:hypothetical protein
MSERQYFDFKSHEEIPSDTAGYILTVADASSIGEISLKHINGFLNGLENHNDVVTAI